MMRLGIRGRTAQAMARLARALRERPLLREAVRRGEVSTRKAEVVLPVARGEEEGAWVARARVETVRALRAAVRGWGFPGASDGAAPREVASPALPDEGEEPWDRLYVSLSAEDRESLDEAVALAGKVLGATAPRWQRLEIICQEYLGEHPVDLAEDELAAPLGASVDGWLAEAKEALERETRAWAFLEAPAAVAAPDGAVEDAGADPRRLDAELRRLAGKRERWDFLVGHLAMLVRWTGVWRDMRFASFVHHVRYRSLGGGDELENLVSLCAAHHLHGVHAGHLHVHGTAPDGLVWGGGAGMGAFAGEAGAEVRASGRPEV